uniref:UPF0114 protein in repA1-repA2 intergenic region n=1 Tax=Buchnera aphidicola subsp. Tetraneura caerulescens TaxID=118111 RepID=YREP_BUCTC|nr:RecName: Full=UPF0114 protein in repA1-repA2 intergenic region [Buchnera aphidicola (Tetraneura caerulescens)]CAA72708.1 putative innermembrane protein [Buchnera aphidicola]
MKNIIEKMIYISRWLIFPIYLGLSFCLILLTLKFFQLVFFIFPEIFFISESGLILVILSLIDIVLVGGLLVMVMFSGYENFISKMNIEGDKLGWMGTMDVNSIKNKVSSAIVAISSVHLLRVFMETEKVSNEKIVWYVIIHLTFVVSAGGMAYIDRLNKSNINSSTRKCSVLVNRRKK